MKATTLGRGLLALPLALAAACSDSETPTTALQAGPGALATISDGAHAGNPHFYFLPPVLAAPEPEGVFDGSLAPVVRICEVERNACGRVIAEFQTGSGAEAVRVSPRDEHYIVNWHTKAYPLDVERTYRITVSAADPANAGSAPVELGHADIDLVQTPRDLVTVESGRYVGLVYGHTLPIKFRIEQGALHYFAADRVLDPTALMYHLNVSSSTLYTKPAGNGEIIQAFGTKDANGTATQMRGFLRYNPANPTEYDVVMRREDGTPWYVEFRDGSKVTYDPTSDGRVRVTFLFPNGDTFEDVVAAAPQTAQASMAYSRAGAEAVAPAASVGATQVQNQQSVDVIVNARYKDITARVGDAVVITEWRVEEVLSPEGAPFTAGGFEWMEHSTELGRYRGLIPIDTRIMDQSLARSACNAINAVGEDFCNAVGSLGYAIEAVCTALRAVPKLSPQQVATLTLCQKVAAIIAIPCAVNDYCQLQNKYLSWFVPNGILTLRTRVHHHTRPGDPTMVQQQHRPVYPPIVFMEADLPPWVKELRTAPEAPTTASGEYELQLHVMPNKPGVPVQGWISGSDEWIRYAEDSALTGEGGVFRMKIPTPEDPGVNDHITGMVGSRADIDLFPRTIKTITRSF